MLSMKGCCAGLQQEEGHHLCLRLHTPSEVIGTKLCQTQIFEGVRSGSIYVYQTGLVEIENTLSAETLLSSLCITVSYGNPAPKLGVDSDEEIVAFIDKYIHCDFLKMNTWLSWFARFKSTVTQ